MFVFGDEEVVFVGYEGDVGEEEFEGVVFKVGVGVRGWVGF